MIRSVVKLSRAATTVARAARLGPTTTTRFPPLSSPPLRLLHEGVNSQSANPVALQMIDYALSLATSQKSDESNAQAMLVLEQCLVSQSSETQDSVTQNSKGMVLLAMSSLLSSRGNYDEAMEKLQMIQDLTQSTLGVRVVAMEALIGLNLELGRDDTSSVLANKCLELLGRDSPEGSGRDFEVANARTIAVKGLVELVLGNLESAELSFQEFQDNEGLVGAVALSYGEFLHATQNFPMAKDLYQKVIQVVAEKDFTDMHSLAACTMASEEVLLAGTCLLGQLEAHMGNFDDAEGTLTRALNKAEQYFGPRHPKVGMVLTCLALMFQCKAIQEHSSSLLVQEGLYRRAIELLKAPPLDSEGDERSRIRSDIIALARETLSVQGNRKGEGEQMKKWAEAKWKNGRLSLAEALKVSESNKVPLIDSRIGRVL
uniref:MalT-like TPR region domain-containing protein n=1 Tax=Rhizophora mucronata TaxID=61149 RepID=A0A2P2KJX5_RHIMU